MGQTMTHYETRVNANCPVCMESGKLPNLAGKFHIINENECKCNGCNNTFNKEYFYIKCEDKKKQK